jgi:hypothetical protein
MLTARLRDGEYLRFATTWEPSSDGHTTLPWGGGSAASSPAKNPTALRSVNLLELLNRNTGRPSSAESHPTTRAQTRSPAKQPDRTRLVRTIRHGHYVPRSQASRRLARSSDSLRNAGIRSPSSNRKWTIGALGGETRRNRRVHQLSGGQRATQGYGRTRQGRVGCARLTSCTREEAVHRDRHPLIGLRRASVAEPLAPAGYGLNHQLSPRRMVSSLRRELRSFGRPRSSARRGPGCSTGARVRDR